MSMKMSPQMSQQPLTECETEWCMCCVANSPEGIFSLYSLLLLLLLMLLQQPPPLLMLLQSHIQNDTASDIFKRRVLAQIFS